MTERPNMSEEQLSILKRMALPTNFDPSYLKRKYLDIQYGTLPEQTLDVYLPDEGDGPFPLIIYVHGGAWSMGTKTEGALDCIKDALHMGYALMTVNYRLAPKAVFPDFLYDVKTAVRWARAHAKEYLFDPERFGMIGDSAGGHLALMIAFTAGHPEYEGEEFGWAGERSDVQAVIDMYGPSILNADSDKFLEESGVPKISFSSSFGDGNSKSTIFDVAFTHDVRMLELISPITYVHRSIPPLMIQQGMRDPIVPMQHSTLLAEKIDRVCGEGRVDLRLYPERTHSDAAFMTGENCKEAVAFFDKHLK